MINSVMIACAVLLIYMAIVETIWLKQFITVTKMENKVLPNESECVAPQHIGECQQQESALEPLRLVIEIPKMADHGEDAPPLLMDLNVLAEDPDQAKSVLLGVFDGMGGAGSELVTLDNGTQRTNAYVGSRTTRQLVEQFFSALETPCDDVAQQLKTWLQNGLRKKNLELEANGSSTKTRLTSTMHKKLPTTMALLWYRTGDEDRLQVTTLWAGDSRCYALSPQNGLLQLTKDDNGADNALLALAQAPPMNNSISASADFTINRKDYELERSSILFTASDGVFDYFPSPIVVEYMIVKTLQESNDMADWKCQLQAVLDTWKQDDVSMAMALPGFKNFNEAKEAFACRYEWLKMNFGTMIEKAEECTSILKKEKALNAKIDELCSCKENEMKQWDKKIAEVEQSIRELKGGVVLGELRKESVRTWKDYQSSYESMIHEQPIEVLPSSGEEEQSTVLNNKVQTLQIYKLWQL